MIDLDLIYDNWDTWEERKVVTIINRCKDLLTEPKIRGLGWLNIKLDLITVWWFHNLDLDKLANSPDSVLLHDISGIRKHLDRETGKLKNNFLPKCRIKNE